MSSTVPIRDARDRAIDRMGFGWTYPLRDLPVNPVTEIVPYGCPAVIQVHYSQPEHDYQLVHLGTSADVGPEVPGTGETIELVTEEIQLFLEQFQVRVTERKTNLVSLLGQTVLVRLGIRKDIEIQVLTPKVDYNQPASLKLIQPQLNTTYQVVDEYLNPWSNPIASTNEIELELNTFPLRDHRLLLVHATNTVSGVKDILDQTISIVVGPYAGVQAAMENPTPYYGNPGVLRLSNVQPDTFYHWKVGTFYHPQCMPPNALVNIEGQRDGHPDIAERPEPIIGPNSPDSGDTSNHDINTGTIDHDKLKVKQGSVVIPDPDLLGLTIDLRTNRAYGDMQLELYAVRYKNPPRPNEFGILYAPPPGPDDLEIKLDLAVDIHVHPKHDIQWSLAQADPVTREAKATIVGSQCGVHYQLMADNHSVPPGFSFKHHKHVPIGHAAIGHDFGVGVVENSTIELSTGLRKDTTSYYVRAFNLYNDLFTDLGMTPDFQHDRYEHSQDQKSLYFNGSGALATLDTASNLGLANSSFTAEAWIKPYNLNGNDFTIFGMSGSSQVNRGLHLILRGKRPYMGFYGNDHQASVEVENNKWTHLCFRYDYETREQAIFINGQFDSASVDHAPFQGTSMIQAGLWEADRWFRGRLAELRIWNYARPDYEIEHNYKRAILEPHGGLVGYWPLNEGTGSTFANQVAGGPDGVGNNTSWR